MNLNGEGEGRRQSLGEVGMNETNSVKNLGISEVQVNRYQNKS